MAESEPKFFKKDFTLLFKYMKSIVVDNKIKDFNVK